jgi:hypothetical protein
MRCSQSCQRRSELSLRLLARLADEPGDAAQIVFFGLTQPVAQLAEQGNAIPVGIGFQYSPSRRLYLAATEMWVTSLTASILPMRPMM